MSAFFNRFEDPTPPGAGMSKDFARRSAVISGMPASQQEVIAQSAKKDFQNRTRGVERQAQADNNAAFSQGIQGIAKLLGTMQKAKQFQAKQQEALANPQTAQRPMSMGIGQIGPEASDPYMLPADDYVGTSEDQMLLELYQMLYGNAPVGVPETFSQYRKGY